MAFRRAQFTLRQDPLDSRPTADQEEVIKCLPDLVEYNATHNPGRLFCVQESRRQGGLEGDAFHRITFVEFRRSVQQCCRWIKSEIADRSSSAVTEFESFQKAPPVALFLESDIGLFVHLIALLTLNIPCVLLSIRLSPAAVCHLLRQTSTATILVSARTRYVVEQAVEALNDGHDAIDIKLVTAASFEEYLRSETTSSPTTNGFHITTRSIREDDRNVLILHSSGTTGLPKPIPQAHRYLLGYAACHRFSEHDEVRGLNLSTLPLYHGFGLLAPCLALSVGMPFCLPHPSRIPTGDTIVTLISRLQPSSLMTVPSILEDISLSSRKSDIQALVPLDFVAIGGGPMKLSVAEKLSGQGVKLLNHFGATELGPLAPIFQPDADYDWHYVRLRTDMGLELERLSPEGEVPQRCRLTGHPFGWNFTFELADELECNPLHPDTEVKIIGRKDDLIVLANGEKILPRILEEALSANQAIRTVVAFGDGQFEIGVIVEPTNPVPAQEHERYIDEFWQMVVLANELMDDHARVSSKTAIIVADKKIPRSDKDSVMRKEAYALYEPKIQAVYEKLNNGKSDGMLRKLNMDNLEDGLKMMVQECLYKKLGARAWTIDDDLFDLGMDSLQATRLRRMLIASTEDLASGHGAIAIPKDFVYYHPSVSQMAIALREPIASDLLNASRQQLMTDYMRQYAFSSFYKSSSANPHSGSVVLLTGSTGNLGAFFLEILCKNPSVRRIICLGRESKLQSLDHGKSGLQKRQERVNLARGIFLSEAEWSKTEFLHWNMGEELLGLTNQEYSSLSREVTHIFHGAWPMDFGRKLQSFKPQIRAMRSLIELGLAVNRANHYIRPRIVLASSIAVVGQYPLVTKKSIVPELPMNDPSVAIPMGYAEAKWVCEKIMEDAATSFPNEIEPIVIRIGQISGSQRAGFWSQAEHIPALIKASQSLGKFPILKGTLSWLPVDMAATILSEITFAKHLESHNIVYHLENPVRQPWPEVSTVLRRNLKHLESNLSLIPFGDWLSAIANDGHSTPELLEFFRDWFLTMGTGILVLDVERAKRLSSTLRNVGPVKDDVVESYIESWRNAKYIS